MTANHRRAIAAALLLAAAVPALLSVGESPVVPQRRVNKPVTALNCPDKTPLFLRAFSTSTHK